MFYLLKFHHCNVECCNCCAEFHLCYAECCNCCVEFHHCYAECCNCCAEFQNCCAEFCNRYICLIRNSRALRFLYFVALRTSVGAGWSKAQWLTLSVY